MECFYSRAKHSRMGEICVVLWRTVKVCICMYNKIDSSLIVMIPEFFLSFILIVILKSNFN